ncbi:hypothetical protein JHW43_000444 [Diplocarpon mali]|nr:hypothetical protein JHW43_000444 [Diplocarpon mali]
MNSFQIDMQFLRTQEHQPPQTGALLLTSKPCTEPASSGLAWLTRVTPVFFRKYQTTGEALGGWALDGVAEIHGFRGVRGSGEVGISHRVRSPLSQTWGRDKQALSRSATLVMPMVSTERTSINGEGDVDGSRLVPAGITTGWPAVELHGVDWDFGALAFSNVAMVAFVADECSPLEDCNQGHGVHDDNPQSNDFRRFAEDWLQVQRGLETGLERTSRFEAVCLDELLVFLFEKPRNSRITELNSHVVLIQKLTIPWQLISILPANVEHISIIPNPMMWIHLLFPQVRTCMGFSGRRYQKEQGDSDVFWAKLASRHRVPFPQGSNPDGSKKPCRLPWWMSPTCYEYEYSHESDDNRPAAVPRSRFLTGRVAVLRRDSGMRTIPLQVSPVVLRDLLVVQTPRAERRILEQQPLRPVKTANQEE